MTERTLSKDEKGYKNLEKAAKVIQAMSDKDIACKVEDCYLDFGQKWMWTTIIIHDFSREGFTVQYQSLSPRAWKEIVGAESNYDILEAVKSIVE